MITSINEFKSILEKKSNKEKLQNFVSDKIKTLMDEGYPHKQAIAIAYSYAEKEGLTKKKKSKKKKVNESISGSKQNYVISVLSKELKWNLPFIHIPTNADLNVYSNIKGLTKENGLIYYGMGGQSLIKDIKQVLTENGINAKVYRGIFIGRRDPQHDYIIVINSVDDIKENNTNKELDYAKVYDTMSIDNKELFLADEFDMFFDENDEYLYGLANQMFNTRYDQLPDEFKQRLNEILNKLIFDQRMFLPYYK
jgi:hypothetical protein